MHVAQAIEAVGSTSGTPSARVVIADCGQVGHVPAPKKARWQPTAKPPLQVLQEQATYFQAATANPDNASAAEESGKQIDELAVELRSQYGGPIAYDRRPKPKPKPKPKPQPDGGCCLIS